MENPPADRQVRKKRHTGHHTVFALLVSACATPSPASEPGAAVAPTAIAPTTATPSSDPTPEPPPKIVSIDMGHHHACALWSSGSVSCWGGSIRRQLGREDTRLRAAPGLVDGLDDAVEIGLSNHLSCARRADGSVECWGSDHVGGLGDGDGKQEHSCSAHGCRAAPGPVKGLERASRLQLGDMLHCAVTPDEQRRCWGFDPLGLFGAQQGDTLHVATPLPDAMPRTRAWAASGSNACGVRPDGSAWCIGDDAYGGLGDGARTHTSCPNRKQCSASPVTVEGLTDVADVTFGDEFACALKADGRVACWGTADAGQLGDGREAHDRCRVGDAMFDCSPSPVMVKGLDDVAEVACGTWHCCARTNTGAVSCWGQHGAGQLGVDTAADRCTSVSGDVTACSRVPVAVDRLPKTVDLATSSYATCALSEDGEVWCWGSDSAGELGDLSEARCRESDSPLSACSSEPLRVDLDPAAPTADAGE